MSRLDLNERTARRATCPYCDAKPGQPCRYTDGVFRGEIKSQAHGGRLLAAYDAGSAE